MNSIESFYKSLSDKKKLDNASNEKNHWEKINQDPNTMVSNLHIHVLVHEEYIILKYEFANKS